MNTPHLAKGSELPKKLPDKLRLYSMLFCPFAQRVRLILILKGVPHDIINVNLRNKPEWLFELHPEGKVPILDTGSEIVIESLDICKHLDKIYPNPPLYSSAEKDKEADLKLIKDFEKLIGLYYDAVWKRNTKTFNEHIETMKPYLKNFEDELQIRGDYFGGVKPNIVDYMIWPWAERAEVISIVFQEKLPADIFPKLQTWCQAMRTQKSVQETQISAERHYKATLLHFSDGVPEYDSI